MSTKFKVPYTKVVVFTLLTLIVVLGVKLDKVTGQLQSIRTIMNDVWDKANHRLMGTTWVGGATANTTFETETTIWNDVWDQANHRLNVSGGGGGGSGAFSDITSGTNATATMTVGTGATLNTSGSGVISATTAGALAADPTDCTGVNFAKGISANGTAACTQPNFTDLAGSATDAQIPNLSGLGTGLTVGRCVRTNDTTGLLEVAASDCSAGGGSSAFNAITSGTNTTAAMVVSTGASLATSGSGTIAATTAAALSSNGSNCSTGLAAGGVSASGVAEDCTDYLTQTEFNSAIVSSTSTYATRYTGAQVLGGSSGLKLSATDAVAVKNGITNYTSNQTLGDQNVITCDPTSGAVTFTLPAASSTTVGKYKMVNTTGANTCSFARAGSDLINSVSTPVTISRALDTIEIELVYTGTTDATHPTNWLAITSKAQFGERVFLPHAAKLPSSNAGILDMSEPRAKILFDTSTQWCVAWTFPLPSDYAGLPTFEYWYSMSSATTGTLAFDISIWKDTSGSSANAQTEDYDTAVSCDDGAVPATTAGKMEKIGPCSLTSVDSMAANDVVTLRMCRDVANDNAAAFAEVFFARLSYLRN